MNDPQAPTVPGPGEVHVWWIDLAAAGNDPVGVLSPDERARADRFHNPRDRVRWTRARVALRAILARYTGSAPEDLRFSTAFPVDESGRGRWGRAGRAKPALVNDPRLRFNLTHAGDRAALAVAWEREVGIDLEPIDPDLDLPPLLPVACTRAETSRIEALPPAQRIEAFLALWTVKEAYLKAIGVGMLRDPRTLEVAFPGAGRAVVHDPDAGNDRTRWDVRVLDAGPGWVAALAVAGDAGTVRTFGRPFAPDASSRRAT